MTTVEGARYMLADGNGQFLFERVEPGRYVLTTEAPGYLTSGYQQRDPASPIPEFEIADGQHRRDLIINAWPGGVVTGAVSDEAGEPVVVSGEVVGVAAAGGPGRGPMLTWIRPR